MAAYSIDAMEDAALNVKGTAVKVTVCAGQPLNYAEATSSKMLADAGAPSFNPISTGGLGRVLETQQITDAPITSDGTGDHVAYVDATTLLYVHTCAAIPLTSGGTVTIPLHNTEVAKPVSV